MSGDKPEGGATELVWRVRLADRSPKKLYGIALVAGFAGVAGFVLFHHVLYSILAILAITLTTGDFWLPIHYKLDANGATSRCGISVTAIEWSSVKRAVKDPDGIKLSPLAQEGKLSAFRGVYLRYASNESDVLRFISGELGPEVGIVEHRPNGGGDRAADEISSSGDTKAAHGDAGDSHA